MYTCSKITKKEIGLNCKKCIFLGYGIDGQFEHHLWDPNTGIVVRSSDIVFYEHKMHKQSVKEVEVRKVVFKDIMPMLLHGISHGKLLLDRMMLPKIMMLSTMMCKMMIFSKNMLRMMMFRIMFLMHNLMVFMFRNH